MPLNIRIDGDVVILSNLARLMNDPRYPSAGREVRDLVAGRYTNFVLELRDVREAGPPLLGLLMTLTRLIRQQGGEVVLAHPSRSMVQLIEMMQLDEFWDVFESVEEANAFYRTPT